MSMKRVWCVAWLEPAASRGDARSKQWCATFRGHRHSDGANNVKTACGMVVVLPVGGEKRVPTCPDCEKVVARRRGQR